MPGFTPEQIDNIFTYHKPNPDKPERSVALRENAREVAQMVLELTPESREQTLAIGKIQESVMFANAAIAINEVDPSKSED